MAKISFQSGTARIEVEAESEERLAAYLAHVAYESATDPSDRHGRYAGPPVKVVIKDPAGSRLWSIMIETPERAAMMAGLRSNSTPAGQRQSEDPPAEGAWGSVVDPTGRMRS